MAMERRMPAQENSLEDLITQMMANRTSEIKKQEEETARVGDEAALVPDTDIDVEDDADESDLDEDGVDESDLDELND